MVDQMYNVKILKGSHNSLIYIINLTDHKFEVIAINKDINFDIIFNIKTKPIDWIYLTVGLTINKLNNILKLLKSADTTIVCMELTILKDNRI